MKNYRYPKTRVVVGCNSVTVPHRPPLHILKRHGYSMTGEFRIPKCDEAYWYHDELMPDGGRVVEHAIRPKSMYFILRPLAPTFKVRMPGDAEYRDISAEAARLIICGCPMFM